MNVCISAVIGFAADLILGDPEKLSFLHPVVWMGRAIRVMEGILRHHLGFVFEALSPRIHVLPACGVWILLVVCCGMGLTWILKKLPGFRQLL